MQVHALGIRFTDNDFCTTISSFMKVVISNGEIFKIKDKAKLRWLINESLFAFYITSQNVLEYNGLQYLDASYIKSMKKYLTVDECDIYIDDEVTDFIHENKKWYNGEFQFIRKYDNGVTQQGCI
jgi:hypothetical protein